MYTIVSTAAEHDGRPYSTSCFIPEKRMTLMINRLLMSFDNHIGFLSSLVVR